MQKLRQEMKRNDQHEIKTEADMSPELLRIEWNSVRRIALISRDRQRDSALQIKIIHNRWTILRTLFIGNQEEDKNKYICT